MQKMRIKTLLLISLLSLFFVGLQWIDMAGVNSPNRIAWSAPAEDAGTAKSPKAVFPESTYEFKAVTEGTDLTHDFIIENHGQAPLVIERVQPS